VFWGALLLAGAGAAVLGGAVADAGSGAVDCAAEVSTVAITNTMASHERATHEQDLVIEEMDIVISGKRSPTEKARTSRKSASKEEC
jgi:hypothetical protein